MYGNNPQYVRTITSRIRDTAINNLLITKGSLPITKDNRDMAHPSRDTISHNKDILRYV